MKHYRNLQICTVQPQILKYPWSPTYLHICSLHLSPYVQHTALFSQRGVPILRTTYLWRKWYTPLSTITMHPSRFVVWTGQSDWWARTPFHCQLIGYNPLIMLPGGKEWLNKITVCKLLCSVRVLVAEPVFAFWTDKTLRDICAHRMQGKVQSMYVHCTHYYHKHTCRNTYQGWECIWRNN